MNEIPLSELPGCPFCGKPPMASENRNDYGRVYCDCIDNEGTVDRKVWATRVPVNG